MVEKIADLSTIKRQGRKEKKAKGFHEGKGGCFNHSPETFRFSNFREISVIKITEEVPPMIEKGNYH